MGSNFFGPLWVETWTDIVQVAAGDNHTVGLKSDGTVVAVGAFGELDFGQRSVETWTDIVQVAAGLLHTVGLKSDGTVVAVGRKYDVETWTDIVQVAAGGYYTLGLKSDGTVVAVGDNMSGEIGTDIVQVAMGREHGVGLKSDGTVMTVGWDNKFGQLSVETWTDIVQVAAGAYHTVGLKSDGTVVTWDWWDLMTDDILVGNIEGQVADGSGNTQEGVVIELYHVGKRATALTDATGRFRFENVPVGNYRVYIATPVPSTVPRTQLVRVIDQATSWVDFLVYSFDDLDFDDDLDIDRDDIQWINYFRGQEAAVCPVCDLDGNGVITGLDARKAVLQCTRTGCATQ